MSHLVDLDRLKRHLRVSHDDEDEEIQDKLTEAEALVLRYVTDVGSPAWDEDSIPDAVKAAILEVATNLWRNRGDDGTPVGPITPRVEIMLATYRDPPFA